MNRLQTIHRIRQERSGLLHILGSRRIRQFFQVVHVIRAPGRALVREDVRIVEMKVVDDVRISQRIEKQQLILRRPVRSRNNNRMLRRPFANRHRQLRLNSLPPIAIVKFRFVQNLEGNEVGIRGRIMPCELTPIILELFDKAILRNEFLFEITFGMNVNDDGQSMVEDHLHRTVEDRKSTRLNSSHQIISYAVFCLKKKRIPQKNATCPTPISITIISQSSWCFITSDIWATTRMRVPSPPTATGAVLNTTANPPGYS